MNYRVFAYNSKNEKRGIYLVTMLQFTLKIWNRKLMGKEENEVHLMAVSSILFI